MKSNCRGDNEKEMQEKQSITKCRGDNEKRNAGEITNVTFQK